MRPLHPLLATLLLVSACASGRVPNHAVAPAGVRSLAGVAPQYQPAFHALKDAVDAHEDATARRILDQLLARLDADAAHEEQAVRDASPGERVTRLTPDARALAAGFERILDGRARVDTMRLELVARPLRDEHAVALVLRGTSTHPGTLVYRPGPATLRVLRVTIAPNGHEGQGLRSTALKNLDELLLDPEGSVEVPLGTYPLFMGPSALAARTTWSLHFRSGEVIENGESYPAMNVPVTSAERTDLARFLPTGPVEPEELASYLERPDVALPPVVERTVRIPEERHDEALDLLTEVALRSTPEQVTRMVPSLRWLARTSAPGGDPLAWKAWLERRKQERGRGRERAPLSVPGSGGGR